jgi:hypothetical protein
MRVAVFCEAAADFSTATDLVDRVLREEGLDWVREHLESYPLDDLREWVGSAGRPFFDLHHTDKEMGDRGILRPRDQFRGQEGAYGALAAYNAFLIARHEASRSGPIEAVVFVWDMDDQGEARRAGLDRGRKAALVPMILGCPDLEREAWVLAGFEPLNAVERDRLEDERKSLRFDPCVQAHRLRDKDESRPGSAKRVVAILTGKNPDREALCWTETPLAILRARGAHSGLCAFLDEVRDLLAPRFGQPPR